jgi:hypothetical protein
MSERDHALRETINEILRLRYHGDHDEHVGVLIEGDDPLSDIIASVREHDRSAKTPKKRIEPTDLRYEGLKDYRGLFAKLKRDAGAFAREASADHLFIAMVTTWSLTDWVMADVQVTSEMHADLLKMTGRTKSGDNTRYGQLTMSIRICRDLAIGSKHAIITSPSEVNNVEFSDGGFGMGPFGGGDNYYILIDENPHDAYASFMMSSRSWTHAFVNII